QLHGETPAEDDGDASAVPESIAPISTIIGFVDNGCAFAHPNFVRKAVGEVLETRVLYIWNQEGDPDNPGNHWQPETALLGYGTEIDSSGLNAIISANATASARELYRAAGYPIRENIRGVFRSSEWSHGTHMMDIAAGARSGVAPGADLIFVQVPRLMTT